MKRAFLDTAYGQVYYVVAGSGEPVILLHQTPRSLDQFTEIIPLLARKKWIIAVDNLGYGDSDKPLEQLSIEEYGKIIMRLMDELGIEQASIVGNHTGAFIGIEVATTRPERIDKLLLFHPVYIDDTVRENIRRFVKTEYKPFEMRPDGSHLMERWQQIRKLNPKMSLDLVNRILLDNLKSGKAVGAGRLLVVNYPMEKRLPLIQCPTFIIWSSGGLPGFPEENKLKVSQAIPRNKVLSFEGRLNFNLMPEKFAKLILDFLGNPGI